MAGTRCKYLDLIQRLMQNSNCLLGCNEKPTLSGFASQFCNGNVRLETLGIFLSAAIRPTVDVPFFPSLYTTETERHELQGLATELGDRSLELCLFLDRLNDFQLIVQYEN